MIYDFGKLSILLPAYNEETRIFENCLTVSAIISKITLEYEIIVINDGSADNTYREIERACNTDSHIIAVDSQPNQGKGHALCMGTKAATGEYIAFCDADLELNPALLEDFIIRLQKEKADVVIGSKMHPQSKVNYPLVRRIYSWGYYLFLWILFHLSVKDTQTGLKLFRADALKPVMEVILVKRFAFDIEVLALLNSRGFKIISAPVELVFQRDAFGRIGIKDIMNMFIDTLAIFYRLKILKYYDKPRKSTGEHDCEPSNELVSGEIK